MKPTETTQFVSVYILPCVYYCNSRLSVYMRFVESVLVCLSLLPQMSPPPDGIHTNCTMIKSAQHNSPTSSQPLLAYHPTFLGNSYSHYTDPADQAGLTARWAHQSFAQTYVLAACAITRLHLLVFFHFFPPWPPWPSQFSIFFSLFLS